MIVRLVLKDFKEIEVNELAILSNDSYLLFPFEDLVIDFFDYFSKLILRNKEINSLPEMVALGFWLRKSNLIRIKKENENLLENSRFKVSPIGTVFHICPSNVDTMFMYSMAVSLLMGNKNILRLSSRMDAPAVSTLFKLLENTINQEPYRIFENYIQVITYDHNDEISTYLSVNSNARLIWGGDGTINKFKSIKTSPRTKDIVFADRVSMVILGCDELLKLNEAEFASFCKLFYNDSYTFNQMGCSSPQTIFFVGSHSSFMATKNRLIEGMERTARIKDDLDLNSIASLKLNRIVDDCLNRTIISQEGPNIFKLLEISEEADVSHLHGCGGGYFYFKQILDLKSINNISNSKVQTISYFGLDKSDFELLILLANGQGIDRIVPVGEALNFNYIWDGYNLLDELSKKIAIR